MSAPSPETAWADQASPRVRGQFLKNLGDFQTELARIQAGWLPGVAVWRLRKELPERVFRSMRRVQELRLRVRELGASFQELHLSASVAGRPLLERLCAAPSITDAVEATLLATPRVLVAAIDSDLHRHGGVYDLPTVPLLQADREELVAQAAWGEAALATLAEETGQCSDPTYQREIEAQVAGLSDALRTPPAREGEAVREGRRLGCLPLARAALPHGFNHLEFGPEPLPAIASYPERARYHAVNFLQEVQAADSCASLLFEAPDMPWEFYLDLSRHLWDESRHAMFGERKLVELRTSAAAAGLSMKAYEMRQMLTPLDRYAALTTQEADAFPGKHVGLKDAIAHQDSVSATAWSYDIADETQHVRFGAKWLPVLIERMRDPRSLEQVKRDAGNWRATVLAEVYRPASGLRAAAAESGRGSP